MDHLLLNGSTMATFPRLRIAKFALFAAVCAGTASAQTNDAVLAGYQQFYGGDRIGAQQHFERLVAARPADLPARFGLLQVLEDASRGNAAREADFERRIDAFLADAERRQSNSAT